jgi:hypothetical protein
VDQKLNQLGRFLPKRDLIHFHHIEYINVDYVDKREGSLSCEDCGLSKDFQLEQLNQSKL